MQPDRRSFTRAVWVTQLYKRQLEHRNLPQQFPDFFPGMMETGINWDGGGHAEGPFTGNEQYLSDM